MAQPLTLLVVTTSAGLEGEARQELRRALPDATFQPLFFKGNLLLSTSVPEREALQRIADARTTVVASATPAQRQAHVSSGLASSSLAVGAAAAEIGRIRPGETFVVRCRRRGTHDWTGRDLEKATAASLAESTGGIGEYQVETDWHVTIQAYQDLAFVGVNRPDEFVAKELEKQRRYAPGERPLNRAQWKLREALSAFAIELSSDARVLDLGSAPGGWAAALAPLAKEVIAVDPADLDPEVTALPNVRHVKARAETLLDNPDQWGRFDLMTSDVNRDPAEVARLLCELVPLLRPGAPAIMTVKYTTRERRRHEREAREILALEYDDIRFRRLPHNAFETTVAMRRRGTAAEAQK